MTTKESWSITFNRFLMMELNLKVPNPFFQNKNDSIRVTSGVLATFVILLLALLALYLRMSGIFRGLGYQNIIFHPDEAKQILALYHFVNGTYVHYVGNLFYDGYPYGLNHLDEYILRPIFLFLGGENVDRSALYYCGRTLRLFYSAAVMAIGYKTVVMLTKNRSSGILALLLFALSPLSITVTHFATGDVGVDLFSALCFFFLVVYLGSDYPKTWLFCCGLAIGAAFSAKYNGLLIAFVPALVLAFEFYRDRNILETGLKYLALGLGTLAGVLIFTPNLLLDFKTTVHNIIANFAFIKNYHVPAIIRDKPWLEKAILGIQKNSFFIIGSLGYSLFISCVAAVIFFGRVCVKQRNTKGSKEYGRNIFAFSLALFPVVALFISLSGKYVVQPFHFSYLQFPLIVATCLVLTHYFSLPQKLIKGVCIVVVIAMAVEFGVVSCKDNFFWRSEDSMYYAENFPESIFKEGFKRKMRVDTFRSIFLEPQGNTSVFRNRHTIARGPDTGFWNEIDVAPVPQVSNRFGKDWLFINGPSFPKNERMLFVNGGSGGTKLKRYLVLPSGKSISGLGFRSGSYATTVTAVIGEREFNVELQAHQQKLLDVNITGENDGVQWLSNDEVHFIPLQISVPHNDVWVTILKNEKEKELYSLFGGGQDRDAKAPAELSKTLKKQYFSALSHVQYFEASGSWKINPGKKVSLWEVAIPSGRYKLICEVEGITARSELAIGFIDANGKNPEGKSTQSFPLKKGRQQIEYFFSKPFAPYQIHFVMSGNKGKSKVLSLELYPDYHRLEDDLAHWRKAGSKPTWVSRF